MPVELKELHIKINVNQTASGNAPAGASSPTGSGASGNGAQSAIVAQCVEQVMALLKQKKER